MEPRPKLAATIEMKVRNACQVNSPALTSGWMSAMSLTGRCLHGVPSNVHWSPVYIAADDDTVLPWNTNFSSYRKQSSMTTVRCLTTRRRMHDLAPIFTTETLTRPEVTWSLLSARSSQVSARRPATGQQFRYLSAINSGHFGALRKALKEMAHKPKLTGLRKTGRKGPTSSRIPSFKESTSSNSTIEVTATQLFTRNLLGSFIQSTVVRLHVA